MKICSISLVRQLKIECMMLPIRSSKRRKEKEEEKVKKIKADNNAQCPKGQEDVTTICWKDQDAESNQQWAAPLQR